MFHRIFHPKVLLFFMLGAVTGTVLFLLGDADDAPGLSFIGLSAGFLLIMRGVYHTGILRRGWHLPLILFLFGAIGLVFPFILYLDGEIQLFSAVSLISWTAGLVMLTAGVLRLRSLRRAKP